MMNASKLVTTQPHIAHGPCSMAMSTIKISPNINSLDQIWIWTNKNIHLWKKTSEISEILPEGSFKRTLSFWPFQLVSTPRIKILLFKSLERTNKASLESETEKDKWSSETVPASLRKKKSENSEVSLRSEKTKMVKMKLLITISPHCSDSQNGLLMPKPSFNKSQPCKSKNKLKCTLTWATLTPLLWVIFYLIKAKIEGKKFFIRCEVFNVSARTFKEAVKYYDAKKNTVSDNPSDVLVPVYKILLSCQDDSIRNNKNNSLNDIWLFSYDGQGSDFVERVDLSQLNEFSTFKQESLLFERRYSEVLESDSVKMTVEVLNDGKGNRAFRALNVKCWVIN